MSKMSGAVGGISKAVVCVLLFVGTTGIKEAVADHPVGVEPVKRFIRGAEFVAKLDTAQIPDVHRTFADRGKTGIARFNLTGNLSELQYAIRVHDLDLRGMLTPDDASDDLTKIHLHEAPVNTPGPHVLNILGSPCEPDLEMGFLAATGTVIGAWDDNDDLREDGICSLDEGPASESLTEKLEALCSGELYVNVHTSYATPENSDAVGDNGEIRGQILPTRRGERLCKRILE